PATATQPVAGSGATGTRSGGASNPKPSSGRGAVDRPPTTTEDTIRGIVSVNGSDRDRHTMVAPPAGRRLEITGSLANVIGHVAGADVWVSGKAAGTS